MTERRPAHEAVPDFVERQIREAQQRGDFDQLPGHGRPLTSLGAPDDDLWWVRRKLRDEELRTLPPALRARRDRDEALAAITEASSAAEVRQIVATVNETIRRINRTTITGPPTATMPLEVDRVLADWRARQQPGPRGRNPAGEAAVHEPARPRRWWQLWRRRRA